MASPQTGEFYLLPLQARTKTIQIFTSKNILAVVIVFVASCEDVAGKIHVCGDAVVDESL